MFHAPQSTQKTYRRGYLAIPCLSASEGKVSVKKMLSPTPFEIRFLVLVTKRYINIHVYEVYLITTVRLCVCVRACIIERMFVFLCVRLCVCYPRWFLYPAWAIRFPLLAFASMIEVSANVFVKKHLFLAELVVIERASVTGIISGEVVGDKQLHYFVFPVRCD